MENVNTHTEKLKGEIALSESPDHLSEKRNFRKT